MIFQPVHSIAKQAANPTIYDLRSTPSIEARIIHLLGGISDFHDPRTGAKIKAKTDYSTLGMTTAKKGKRGLSTLLSSNSIDRASLDSMLLKGVAQNDYYTEIFDELSRAIHLTQTGKQVQAFLHIYRALERISYSFPMIYAAATQDYKGTFLDLKNLFVEDKIEELGFFKRFATTLIDRQYLNATVKIHINHTDPQISAAHYSALEFIIPKKTVTGSVQDTEIDFRYEGVLGGIITLRNRYFHFMSGRTDNLTSANIIYPDIFFEPLNPVFINWISFIHFRILEQRTK